MKNKLFVFAGKPGVGKTTVIKSLFPDEKIIDILPFVMQFQIDGDVPEEKTFLGYQAMYQHIAQHGDDLNVVEIGTNYPVLNISELQKLNQKYQVKIFLCDAAKETLRARAQ
jgi:hypothetical protein